MSEERLELLENRLDYLEDELARITEALKDAVNHDPGAPPGGP